MSGGNRTQVLPVNQEDDLSARAEKAWKSEVVVQAPKKKKSTGGGLK